MSEPGGSEKQMRVPTLVALFVVVVVAPLIGVYTFSPFFFVWGIEPYQLATALGVMLAEAIAAAALYVLLFRPSR
jgi:hypothetical protein